MSFSLNNVISGVENKKARILLYSMPKVGKTTFASQFPNHLIVDIDGSSERIDCVRTPHIITLNEFLEILESLYSENHSYTTLAIDTIDWLERLIGDEVARINGKKTVEDIAFGKGYPLVVARWREILKALEQLRIEKGMTILMLSHADTRHYTPPMGDEYDIYAPKLYGKKDKTDTSLALITEYCDIIAFAHNKVLTKETGTGFNQKTKPVGEVETILYTSSRNPCFIAGNRFNLSPELPFTYAAFLADLKANAPKANKPKITKIEEEK